MHFLAICLKSETIFFSFLEEAPQDFKRVWHIDKPRLEYSVYELNVPLHLPWKTLKQMAETSSAEEGRVICDFLSFSWDFLKNRGEKSLISFLPQQFHPTQNDVAIFAGSFRPWHRGHQECVEQALLNGVTPIIVPDNNPWKDSYEKEENPLQIVMSIFEANKDLDVHIYTGFMASREPNPTVDWLPSIKLPKKRLIMGDDSFFSIHCWKLANDLINEIDEILVVPRLGDDEKRRKQMQNLKSINPNIQIRVLKQHPYEKLSSTQIREKQ